MHTSEAPQCTPKPRDCEALCFRFAGTQEDGILQPQIRPIWVLDEVLGASWSLAWVHDNMDGWIKGLSIPTDGGNDVKIFGIDQRRTWNVFGKWMVVQEAHSCIFVEANAP